MQAVSAPGGRGRRRRWLVWPIAVIGICLVLAPAVVMLERHGVIATGMFDGFTNDEVSRDGVFPVTIGDGRFIVSGRFLRRIARDDKGEVEQIELALPWPADVEAVLTEAVVAPDAPRVSDTVFVSIKRRDVLAQVAERLERIYPHYLSDEEPRLVHGLEARSFNDDTAYRGQELLSGTAEDGLEFALSCDIRRTDNMPSMCRRQFLVQEGFAVIYRYHRDHLADWRDIEAMVARFFDGLRALETPDQGT
jgi:hypothetical protein